MPENEELDEQSLFNSVVSDEPEVKTDPGQIEQQVEADAKTEQARDEAGKFAKADEPEKLAAEEDPDKKIPVWRREEMAEARRNAERDAQTARDQLAQERFQREALQRELSALRPKEEKAVKPDPLLDPEGYEKYLENRFEERILNDRREFSLANAHKTYKGEFEEAYAAAQKQVDPALKARMQQSRDPGETLMEWHRENKTKAEIGGDLTAYKARLREEALKDPEFRKAAMEAWRGEASTQTKDGRPRVDLGPSLNGMSRTGSLLKSSQADVPDHELWNEITGTG